MAGQLVSRVPEGLSRPTPVLLIHGAFQGSWIWERLMPRLAAEGYSVHALNLRGHGASAGRRRLLWRIRDYVRDVEEAVARLPVPPVLIGHSMGGFVVQKYLERHQAPAAALIAPVPPRGAALATLKAIVANPLGFLLSTLTVQLWPIMARPATVRRLFYTPSTTAEQLAADIPRMNNESYLAFLDMLALDRPGVARIRAPILVLGAEEDGMIDRGDVLAAARDYRTEPRFYPGGHMLMLGRSSSLVADDLLAWLETVTPTPVPA